MKKNTKKNEPSLSDHIQRFLNGRPFNLDELIDYCSRLGFKKNDITKEYMAIEERRAKDDQIEVERLILNKPLIVPPGLNSAVLDFEAHFAVSGKDPIMILGETGVGKTLFLNLSRRLFKGQYQNEDMVPPIVQANCAHFGENLARSELFGHVRGAFTDAKNEKVGLVEKADGGLLILEEIGELPFEVQAMLLMFIETGEYNRVGDVETRRATLKIVGATNRETDLRDDFRYRFFPYYIPSIRERKGDILYYFYELFPEITKSLTRSEVLLLLAHHWPGNVRELERIGRLIEREQWIRNKIAADNPDMSLDDEPIKISHLNPNDTSFDPDVIKHTVNDLKEWGIDVPFIDKLFKKRRIALIEEGQKPAFSELSQTNSGYGSWFDEFTLKFCDDFEPFEEAYEGFLCFCELFLQDPEKEKNILATIRECSILRSGTGNLDYPPSYDKKVMKLIKDIMKWLKEVRDTDYKWPDNPYVLWGVLEQKTGQSVNKATRESVENAGLSEALVGLKEADLLRLYYRKKLEKTGGNVKAAARLIGVPQNTFRSRMSRLGIVFRKKEKTKECDM